MVDLLKGYTPREANKLFTEFLDASRKKMPEGLRTSEEYDLPFKYLCGDESIFKGEHRIHHNRYTNLLFPAWKAFAPKFCSKPPNYIVKQLTESRRMLAEACQKLFEFKMQKFSYSDMILEVAQDAFFAPCGYGRHTWNKRLGMTVTNRFKPTDVMWDHSCTSPEGAKYVIERHKIKRYQLEKKYGRDIAYAVRADEDSLKISCPDDDSKYPDGKHPFDDIEYFLFWSKIGGYNRVYPFFEHWPEDLEEKWIYKSPVDGKPGEPWELDFDEDQWHLTQLKLSNVNGRIGGLSTFQAGKGSYLQFQDLSGAQTRAAEESAKKVMVYPIELESLMTKVREAGGTLSLIGYDRQRAQMNDVNESIKLIEFPGPDQHLISATDLAERRFQEITGMNAAIQQQSGSIETAVEARTLESAASNRIADDQGAVERWVTLVGKKELSCDLMKMPRRSSIRVNRSEYGGEFTNDKGPGVLHDIPYEEAVLLEKGIANLEAAQQQIAETEAKESELILAAVDPQIAKEQAAQMPMDGEVRARLNRKIGLEDEVEIVIPGVEQFVGPELSEHWVEDMTRRQIEAELLVTIQLGSSTAAGRSQQVNEVLMIAKLLEPIYREFELWDKVAFIYNSVIDASELENLKDAKLNGVDLATKWQEIMQRQAEAKQQEFQQQLELKKAPENESIYEPARIHAELRKADAGVEKQALRIEEAKVRVKGEQEHEEARSRNRTDNQLLSAQLKAMQ
jgi:hypothetical protein